MKKRPKLRPGAHRPAPAAPEATDPPEPLDPTTNPTLWDSLGSGCFRRRPLPSADSQVIDFPLGED